ncbi:MAG: thioredoxin [Spirochaetaceae bacterium]|nr:MAG: thioredoxin [Spirochaetaceae bacterium]
MTSIQSVRDMENVVLAHTWVCIFFLRTDCAVSADALPRVSRMLKRFSDVVGCRFNIDDDPAAAGRYLVFDTPAVIVYFKGKPVIRQSGGVAVNQIYDALQKMHQQQDLS